MITVPTTLVLGAGASKPYGFPSGAELRALLSNANNLRGMIGFNESEIQEFSSVFSRSGMPSIDAFLARRGTHKVRSDSWCTFSDIGKAAIAYCLIKNEHPDRLFSSNLDDHWYQYLWSLIADSLGSFGENKLHIITFNYDRSLEFYLLTALQSSFGISAAEAAIHLKKIPILHVYGQLGELQEAIQARDGRAYSNNVSSAGPIEVAAAGIRVIDESRDDDAVFEQAYSYLKSAQRIYFLGFGFDETNVRRLRLDTLVQGIRKDQSEDASFFATTMGLKAAERNRVIQRLNVKRYPFDNHRSSENIAEHGDLNSEQYLRTLGVLHSPV